MLREWMARYGSWTENSKYVFTFYYCHIISQTDVTSFIILYSQFNYNT